MGAIHHASLTSQESIIGVPGGLTPVESGSKNIMGIPPTIFAKNFLVFTHTFFGGLIVYAKKLVL